VGTEHRLRFFARRMRYTSAQKRSPAFAGPRVTGKGMTIRKSLSHPRSKPIGTRKVPMRARKTRITKRVNLQPQKHLSKLPIGLNFRCRLLKWFLNRIGRAITPSIRPHRQPPLLNRRGGFFAAGFHNCRISTFQPARRRSC
jgi:hypothetical protein